MAAYIGRVLVDVYMSHCSEPTVHPADRGVETGVLDLPAFVYIVISEMFRSVLGQHCGNHTHITLKLLLVCHLCHKCLNSGIFCEYINSYY